MPSELSVDRDVIDDVRIACERSGRPTEDAEIVRALDGLSTEEVDALQRISRGPLAAKPLGPDALVDIVRGVPPMKAAAREVGGYYELKAERDALANIARQGPPPTPVEAAEEEPEAAEEAEVEEQPEATPRAKKAPKNEADEHERQAMMTLFAYHRDAVRVAQELGLGLGELNERIDALELRRKIHRLLESTTDIDAFRPERMAAPRATGTPTPVVRRRTERPVQPEAEAASETEETQAPDTTPVTPFGTRVYRRAPLPQQAVTESAAGLEPRREYVRETRRRAKARQAPAAKPVLVEPPKEAPRRPFSDLQDHAGGKILERLLADEKANPRGLAAKLSERFAGPNNRPVGESDIRALMQHHGLSELFREREIVNTRFLLGFHQGARGKLANALLMKPEELTAYLAKLGLTEELERTRSERARVELGRRRINDRLAQVLTRAPYLDDLGVLGNIDGEVREHLEKLFAEHRGPNGAEEVRAELGVEKNPFAKLLKRYQMESLLPT